MHEQFSDRTGATIHIRPYQDDDWGAICAVHDRSRPDELRSSCNPRAFVPLAQDQEYLDDVRRSRKLVACDGERVVAFVGVDGSYLSWLYVDPDYYGRGIGRRLLQIGKRLIGPDAWTIALAGNTRAIQLYASEGFTIVQTFQGDNAGYPCEGVRLALNG